jgi:hypothetical protein
MYFPKSQIKTSLYTNGNELINKSTSQPYIGYYYKTSSGKYYTGKTPEEGLNIELIPTLTNSNITNIIDSVTVTTTTNTYSVPANIFEANNEGYNQIKNVTLSLLLLPTFYQPQPTSTDYQVAEFQRYFVKKTNEIIYIEVNKDTYENITNKNPQWAYQYYITFNIPWVISGDKLTVAKTNKNIVDLTMQRFNLPKFNMYLRNDYTKFYK